MTAADHFSESHGAATASVWIVKDGMDLMIAISLDHRVCL